MRVVEERPGGIVGRGAKVHTSVSTNTNEVIVLPTRAMRAEDKPYAVAFALPINTPGLKLISSPHGSSPNTAKLPRFVQYINYSPIDEKESEEWV